jgi:nucleoside-diphosphate-sugar epimerase
VYGHSTSNLILEESNKIPITFYGKTKYCQEKLMFKFCKAKKIPLDIFRIFNVFGEEQHKFYSNIGIIPMIYQQIIQNNKVVLLNEGNIIRDFIYIEDVVKILFLSLTNIKPKINIYNLGSGIGVSLLEICQIFKKLNYSFSLELSGIYYNDTISSIANNQKIKTSYNYNNFFSVKKYIIQNYKKVIQ